ncbi:kinase activator [Lithospermum erythrorhizon]|uniref:Kinase activator n=1 Tax=Lithospermum erythrorhizon TaxID=34254 RepID=A0AAV3QX79_LITER
MAKNSIDLLCDENQNMCFDDLNGFVDPTETNGINCENDDKVSNFMHNKSDPLMDLASLSEDEFEMMIVREMDNLPKNDYLERLKKGELDVSVRKECVEWIWKAHMHYGFTEQCFALAVNYYDRFMSDYELPRGAAWANQLLAVACLSLAAKMEEVEVPRTVDLQVGEPKAIFEGKTIQRMELMVLNTLRWKLHACTPCTFIDYFLIKMTNDQHPIRPLIAKAVEIILSTIKGIDFLEFRPCEIAAAVTLSVLGGIEAVDTDKALSCFKQLEKDRVLKCIEMTHNIKLISPSSSPNGVLEAACMSCKTDEKTVD